MQLNGISLTSKLIDFNTQYDVPDTAGMTNTTTLRNNPLYNIAQVIFQGTKSDNISAFNSNDLFIKNGLKANDRSGWIV